MRALRAGASALRTLVAGELKVGSPSLPYRDNVFVVLRSRIEPGSWVCYSQELLTKRLSLEGFWDTTAVFHGFPSIIEGEIYLRGAEWDAWPLEVTSRD